MRNKSKKETSVEVAFANAEKSGWTKEKVTDKFTIYPSYRYYTQDKAKYFAPFETHLSTEKYYTSDYDLSTFNANQYGFGVSYTDIFTSFKILKFGLKNLDLRFSHYDRNDGLKANIITFGVKFVEQ